MADSKKHILFLYTAHTVPSTVSLMKRLLSKFPEDTFEQHMLQLTSDHPGAELQDYIAPFKRNLYLIFQFDCLGFNFTLYDGSPYYNGLWTPCVTLLTLPAKQLHPLLRVEANLNITVLCLSSSEEQYVRKNYPQYDDVRTVVNPLQDIEPLYQTLYKITERYE